VDSPGGTVGGIPEAAAAIAGIGVPTFAYVGAGAMNCSGAYYLTAGCDRIYGSHSSEMGSIGVYRPWIDRTEAMAKMGYKVELITNKEGDLKGTGFPGTSLSAAQREHFAEKAQETFDDFAAHVRTQRAGKIDTDSMRGQSFSARQAYQRNLIDGVVPYESALRSLKRFRRD
jgi:ClpP class serine protease